MVSLEHHPEQTLIDQFFSQALVFKRFEITPDAKPDTAPIESLELAAPDRLIPGFNSQGLPLESFKTLLSEFAWHREDKQDIWWVTPRDYQVPDCFKQYIDRPRGFLRESAKDEYYTYNQKLLADVRGYRAILPQLPPGQILIDVGAGGRAWGWILAELMGATGYVAVEPNYPLELFFDAARLKLGLKREISYFDISENAAVLPAPNIPISIIPEPMEIALKRFPDSAGSIFTSALEVDVAFFVTRINPNDVMNEIVRCISSDGLWIENRSNNDPYTALSDYMDEQQRSAVNLRTFRYRDRSRYSMLRPLKIEES